MNLQTKKTFSSKIYPGVTAEYRVLSERERTRLDIACEAFRLEMVEAQETPVMQRIEDARKEAEDAGETFEGVTLTARERVEHDGAQAKFSRAFASTRGAWLEAAVVSIEGVTVDDRPAEVAEVLENASEEFLSELYVAVLTDGKLTEEAEKNSESPSTSPA